MRVKPYYQDEAVTIYNGDCRELLPVLPKADFLFDDPPYLEGDWWSLAQYLFASADRVVVTPGAKNLQSWLRDWVPFWVYCWLSASNSVGGSACLHIGWEPIVAFHRPLMPLGNDVLNFPISQQRGTGDHPWPKPLGLVKKLVTHWSQPRDLVLDPHMGSGTMLRAAKDLGRKAIGIEIEEKYCELAARRMGQEVLAL